MSPTLRKRTESSPEKLKKSNTESMQSSSRDHGADGQKKQIAQGASSSVASRIPGFVLGKLVLFSALAITLPILVFYYSLDRFGSTYAGVWAAITANFVLIMYIIVAWMEGEEEEGSEKKTI